MLRRTNGIAATERQDHSLDGECDREKVLWTRISLLEIDYFTAGARREVRRQL